MYTTIPNGEQRFSSLSSVVFGKASVERLGEKVEELNAKRALVVTGSTIATKTDLVDRIKSVLGDKYAGVFSGVVQHVPRQCVIEGAKMARETGADILVSLGGSSPSDAAKAMSLVLTEEERLDEFFVRFNHPGAVPPSQYDKIRVFQIAVPTTLSGGEFSSLAGISDTERGIKESIFHDRLAPRAIILDPEMTSFTPSELWGSTAMKLLSDSIGRVCSVTPLPFSDALGLHAIRVIREHLLPSMGAPLNLEARAMMMHAVWLCAYGYVSTGLGIIPSLRHQIGAAYGVVHGVASTIVFPYCVEFNRPYIDDHLVPVADALDLPFRDANDAADSVVKRVRDLISETALPTRLRDVGVPEEGLSAIAEASMHDFATLYSLRPVESKEQLLGILEQSW
jgi:alcohol dehydrogenase class IV